MELSKLVYLAVAAKSAMKKASGATACNGLIC